MTGYVFLFNPSMQRREITFSLMSLYSFRVGENAHLSLKNLGSYLNGFLRAQSDKSITQGAMCACWMQVLRQKRALSYSISTTVMVQMIKWGAPAAYLHGNSPLHRTSSQFAILRNKSTSHSSQPVECDSRMTTCDFFRVLAHLGILSLSKARIAAGREDELQRDSARMTPSLSAILAPLPAKGLEPA